MNRPAGFTCGSVLFPSWVDGGEPEIAVAAETRVTSDLERQDNPYLPHLAWKTYVASELDRPKIRFTSWSTRRGSTGFARYASKPISSARARS